MQNVQRNIGADLLKWIASILVVGIHVTPEYQGGPLDSDAAVGGLLIQSLVRLGLPVFFVFSGYFLLNRSIPEYIPFYKSRIPRLLIPFFIYASLYVVTKIAFEHLPITQWPAQFAEILYAPTLISGHFWFIGSMLGIYLVAPALNALVRNLSTKAYAKASVALIVICVFQTFAPTIFNGVSPVAAVMPPKLDMWLAFFLLGGFLRRIDGTRYVKLTVIVAILGYGLSVLFYYLRQNKLYDFQPHDGGINMLLLATASAYLLIAAGTSVHSPRLRKFIDFGARHSFGVYLVHLLVMPLLGRLGFFDTMTGIHFYMVVVSILVTYLLALAVACVMDRVVIEPLMHRMESSLRRSISLRPGETLKHRKQPGHG